MRASSILLVLGVACAAFAVWRVATKEKKTPAGGRLPSYVLRVMSLSPEPEPADVSVLG